MTIFIQSGHKQRGIHRFLDSFLIDNSYQIVFINKAEELHDYNLENAIIGGFLPNDKEILRNKTIRNKYYVFCSPFGQADLSSQDFYSQETSILFICIDLVRKGIYKNIIVSSKSVASRFNFIYVPASVREPEKIRRFTLGRKNYGFLGNNFRKHKNAVNQLAAISKLEPKEKIIVNNAEHYKYYGEFFDCKFESKDLRNDEDYYNEISTHRLCFQVSFSESFDYQAFEYFLCGVPVVISSCLRWYSKMVFCEGTDVFDATCDIFAHPFAMNPDDWFEIYEVGQSILNSNKYKEYSEELYEKSFLFNVNQQEKLLQVLRGIK